VQPVWVVLSGFVYGRVVKYKRRRKLVKVERQVICGDKDTYRNQLKAAGLSGRINTSFMERVNLTIRQGISKLTRRTWGAAQFTVEFVEHLEWWRAYYHFVRYHDSLRLELGESLRRKGRQTPAMAAGLTQWRWTVGDVISYPLP
jgi:hypothetical protein